jgi:hypothetical protein
MKLIFNNREVEIKYNGDDRTKDGKDPIAILTDWKDVIICALNTRMYHCTKQVLDNVANITYVDDYIICYGDGQHYSNPAMLAMRRGVMMLRDGQYTKFLQDGMYLIQAIKALSFLGNQSNDKSDYTFVDLMDVLVDHLDQMK